MILELCDLPVSSDVVLIRIWKNNLPVALRYVQLSEQAALYPTVSLLSKSAVIQCDVIPPNVIEQLPSYFVRAVFISIVL